MINFQLINEKHTAGQALQFVHQRMIDNLQLKDDKEEALLMQKYLRYFKKIFYNPKDYLSNDKMLSALGLEQSMIESMRTRFQEILGVSSNYKQIFRSEHRWYENRKDFDDIVEGELNALLQTIAEKATGVKNINLGQKIVGNDKAIIDIEGFSQETVNGLTQRISERISQKEVSKIVDNISVSGRSGKTDVKGYSKELIVSAEVKKEFEDFIKLFANKNFSIKNYKGNSKFDIHLGSTIPIKAMYASLRSLGYSKEESVHIYAHSVASYNKNPNQLNRNTDIFHLRFIYELTGNGLYDADTKKQLDAVDYLIYNDPTSENIYVKSTKEMINDILNSKKLIKNPWKGVYVTKESFK